MLLHLRMNLLLLWITYVNGYQCNEGCGRCLAEKRCDRCEYGYFLQINSFAAECFKCPPNCTTCSTNQDCQSCKPKFYGKICEHSCSLCKNNECTKYGCVNSCKSGYYLEHTRYNTCTKCSYRCTECTRKYACSSCNKGWFGDGCRYSCIPCSQCVSVSCTKNCREYQGYRCVKPNSTCHAKCSLDFSGARRDEAVSSTLQTITISTTQQLTTLPTTHSITRSTPSTTIHSTPSTSTLLNTPLTTRSTPATTRRRTQLTSKPPKPQPSTSATSNTDGSDTPTLYILIAVIGVLFLVVAIMVGIFIKKRKQTSRLDHGSASPDTQVSKDSLKGEDLRPTDRRSRSDDISSDQTEPCFHVFESETKSRQLNDNVMGTSTVSYHDIAIGNSATINVAESDTEYVNTNITTYINNADNLPLNVDPIATVNTYEGLSQYINVKEAENAYTALSGDENVYYTIPD